MKNEKILADCEEAGIIGVLEFTQIDNTFREILNAQPEVVEPPTRFLGYSVPELQEFIRFAKEHEYCPNSPLKSGEACFCGRPVRPIEQEKK